MSVPAVQDDSGRLLLVYSSKVRGFFVGLGIVCIIFGLLPLFALQFPGETVPKLLLAIGFISGGVYCILEARRFLLVDDKGISGGGAFHGLRSFAWDQLGYVKDYRNLQMVRIVGGSPDRPVKLWGSYLFTGIGLFIVRLNQRGIPLEEQKPYLQTVQTFIFTKLATSYEDLELQVGPSPIWFAPFVLSVWPLLNPQKQPYTGVVLTLLNGNGHAGYLLHLIEGAVTARQAVEDLLIIVRAGDIRINPEYAAIILEEFAARLEDPLNWPTLPSTQAD